MKTFDRKDIYSWSNAEEAKAYIGKPCYFGDSIAELQEVVKCISEPDTLKDILESDAVPTQCIFNASSGTTWGLCIPIDKVKEVEEPKNWRPFKNRTEFKEATGLKVGDTILFKEKENDPDCSSEAFILSLDDYGAGCTIVTLGGLRTSNQILFDKYEYSKDNGETWQTFGVLEK